MSNSSIRGKFAPSSLRGEGGDPLRSNGEGEGVELAFTVSDGSVSRRRPLTQPSPQGERVLTGAGPSLSRDGRGR
jgi:hypothetical protein